MTSRILMLVLSALALAAVSAGAAAEPAPGAKGGALQVSLAEHGTLTFQVPEGWVSQVKRQSPSTPPTVSFDPPSGERFNVQITVIWKTPDVPAFDPEHLRKVVEQSRDQAAKGATIREPSLKEVQGDAVHGWCYSAVDEHSKAKPGDWKYMTQGAAAFPDDLLLTFTILGNDPKEPEAAMALAMIKTSKYDRAPGAATGAGDPSRDAAGGAAHQEFRVSLPGKNWALALDLPGFKSDSAETRPDGSGAMMMATNESTGLIVSAYVEKEAKIRSVDECKRHYWGLAKNSPFRKNDVHEVAKDGMMAVHYVVPELKGMTIQQKNVNAYLYRDECCIDIHLSKTQYDIHADEPLFTAVLDTVRFVEQ